MSTKRYIIIVLTVVVGLLVSFYSGYFLNNLLNKSKTVRNYQESKLKPYYSDEMIIITKDEPHLTLIAYSSRKSTDNKTYNHRQKVFFFDGSNWDGKIENKESNNSDIEASQIIPRWKVTNDPSLVLKQSIEGEVSIGNRKIQFQVPTIYNELGIRSLDSYTIFRSEANGKLKIDGREYESYVLYTRNYAFLSSINLIEVTKPVGIETDFIAFWDTDGNFYNIDKTITTKDYEGDYKSHSLVIFKDNEDKVQKSFDVSINKEKIDEYQIDILEPINKQIYLKNLNSIDKNITLSPYLWETGQTTGFIKLKNGKKINGFGIYERLYQ